MSHSHSESLVKGSENIYFCHSSTAAIATLFHFLFSPLSWLGAQEEGPAWDLLAVVRGESVLISY